MKPPITVWEFESAPEELRMLSVSGGDENWIAEIPPEFKDIYITWLEEGGPFGCCAVDECDHPSKPGYKVRIGSHS